MDGLLVDSEPLWFEVEHSVMSRLGGEWTEADQRALVGGSLHRSVGYLLSRASRPAGHGQVADWLIGGMAELLAEREVAVHAGRDRPARRRYGRPGFRGRWSPPRSG